MGIRRCYILEESVRELLEPQGYRVDLMTPGRSRKPLPVNMLASRSPDERRYIRIKKMSGKPFDFISVERFCKKEIPVYRRVLASRVNDRNLHFEIWIFVPSATFHCYEVLRDGVREIPALSLKNQLHTARAGGAA